MKTNRPTFREIDNKLKQAREAAEKGHISFINPDILAADALDLDVEIKEIPEVLSKLMDQATPRDYIGTSPPQQSYEETILQCELFSFRITSLRFGCKIYFKFALKEGFLWLVSLHRDRPEKGAS